MGTTAFCGNCSEVCKEQISEIRCDAPEKDRTYAFRRVFELTDLDNDGRITVDDFVLVGLYQTRLYAHPPLNQQQEEEVKDALVQKYREIDPNFEPVPYFKYKAYLARTLDSLHLEDAKASGWCDSKFKCCFTDNGADKYPPLLTRLPDRLLSTFIT